MKNYLTKTQAEIQKQTTAKKSHYSFGEIHPHLLGKWDEEYSKNEKINIMISYLGKFELERNIFPKMTCPICNKEEFEVYDCFASILSGAHVLRGVCKNCNEIIAFEDSDCYHNIRDYLIKTSQKRNIT